MPKSTALTSTKKSSKTVESSVKPASNTKNKSYASSLDVVLPYIITVFKDGLNYRVTADIQLLSGTCPTDISVSIEKGEFLNVEFPLPETLFASSRLHSSGVELGEDRVAKFEEEVLSLRQRYNMTAEKKMKTRFKIQLPMKVEDRFWKSKKTKAIGLHMYDMDKKNIDFQYRSRQTVQVLHINMTAQEKLVDYDDDDVDFQAFTTDFSNFNAVDKNEIKKRKTSHDPSDDTNMNENNYINDNA